jgi:hypothetical protein
LLKKQIEWEDMSNEMGGGVTGRGTLKLELPWQNEEVNSQD